MQNLSQETKKMLHGFAKKEKAEILKRFFKTGKGEYGEGDKFLGVVVPDIRKTVKYFWKEISMSQVLGFLHSEFHEERLFALLVLVEKYKYGNDLEKKKIFEVYLKNIKKYINNWDLVDLTAPNIVGDYLYSRDRKLLKQLAKSNNLWEKRVAILSTFYFIYRKESKDTVMIARMLLSDKHDLIHKAVGWMLREVGKRCSVDILEDFLKANANKMPRTALRCAIERLPQKRRVFWLKYQ